MQAQQQAAQNQNAGARPLQPGQPMTNMSVPNGQNFANALQRTPQMQAQAQMMAGLQQVRPGGPQSTPTMGSQPFLQPSQQQQQQQQSPAQPQQQMQQQGQQQQQAQQPNQQQQVGLQGPAQMSQQQQQQQQMARGQPPQQVAGHPQNAQPQQQIMGQQPGQPGQQRPVPGRTDTATDARNQQNPLNFLRLLHQRVTDIESKLSSDLSAEERQAVQQQHAEAKRLQSALLQRLNVQNAQQFAALMQQGQQQAQNPQANQAQPNQPSQSQQPQQPQPQHQQMQHPQGLGVMGTGMMGNNPAAQPQASPVIRPPNRPGSARPPQGQFGSPMLNQPGLQNQNAQQTQPHQSPQVRPSPQMGAINVGGQPGMSGLQGVPSLRPEQFMKALVDLMKKRGTPITSLPKVGGRELDLYRFYQIVQAHGGSEGAHQKGAWPAIAMSLELAPLGSPQTQALGQALATEYRNYLAPFEETWQRAMQHQYQMSMAGAGLAQGQGAGQPNAQAPAFRPPSTPQMQSQQQQPQQSQQAQPGQQPSMMPPNVPQQQPQGAQQPGRPGQPSLADFNPPPPPILTADHLAKLGMTQEQFNKVFLNNQLNIWRQEQLQNQQRQLNSGFQAGQAGANNMAGFGQNGMQQPAPPQQAQPQQQQQQQAQQQQTQQQAQQQMPMGWPNQVRPMMPQIVAGQPSQSQPAGFGSAMPGAQQMQNPGQLGANAQQPQQPPQQQQPQPQQQQQAQAQMPGQPSQQSQPGQQNASGVPNASGQPQGQQGQMAGRPNNMAQARFIAVSPEQLEQARAAMQKIDQELATQRPRLPIIQNIADDERDQILDQVQKLAPIQATVTALLPAFYAMNGNLEPAKRLKIMAFMYKDQFDLLPKKQCILRLADLDKLKMQMSRCISFVRSSNPDLAARIIASLGDPSRMAAAMSSSNANAPAAPGANTNGSANAPPSTSNAAAVPAPPAAAPAEAGTNVPQGADAAAGAANADGTFDAAAAMHGIKRGLRPENLKLPPNKRAKNAVTGKAMSPSAGANESPRVAPSPAQPEDTPTPAGSTPAGKGGKKNDKPVKAGKTTVKKGKGAAGTPTSSAAEPDKKFKTSADIMAEVKREMAEAERKRREEGGGGASAGDASAGAAAAKVDSANIKAEEEAEEKRRKDSELARRDPAGLVESTWQELLATGHANNNHLRGMNGMPGDLSLLGAPSGGAGGSSGSDPKALQSLMSLLGQDSMLAGLPADGSAAANKGSGSGDGGAASGSAFLNGAMDSLPSADADAGLDIDLFDFIEASAAGPDAFNEADGELGGMFGTGGLNASTQESEPPVETPELVASARLPGGSSNASSSSNSTHNSLRAKLPGALGGHGLDFGSAGPSSTSPAEMSSCDEIDLDKSPFVHRMRLDRIGLTIAPAASAADAGKATSTSATSTTTNQAGQSTAKAPEEAAVGQVELGPGSHGIIAGSGDEWWDLDHFGNTLGGSGAFGSDANADQPWAVLS